MFKRFSPLELSLGIFGFFLGALLFVGCFFYLDYQAVTRGLITRDSPNSLRSHVMEVAAGADVAENVAQLSRRSQRGVCILSGSGTVVGMTLKQPGAPGTLVSLHGRFEILSLSGFFLPGPAPSGATWLTVYISTGQGQVVGGSVVGPLIAAGPVMVIGASFANATYERFPLEEKKETGNVPGQGQDSSGPNSSPTPFAGEWKPRDLPDPSTLPVYNEPPNKVHDGGRQLGHEASNPWAGGRLTEEETLNPWELLS